jgi:hypothetical protein
MFLKQFFGKELKIASILALLRKQVRTHKAISSLMNEWKMASRVLQKTKKPKKINETIPAMIIALQDSKIEKKVLEKLGRKVNFILAEMEKKPLLEFSQALDDENNLVRKYFALALGNLGTKATDAIPGFARQR